MACFNTATLATTIEALDMRWLVICLLLGLGLVAATSTAEAPAADVGTCSNPTNATDAAQAPAEMPAAAEVKSLPSEILPDWSDFQRMMDYASELQHNMEWLFDHWWQEVGWLRGLTGLLACWQWRLASCTQEVTDTMQATVQRVP